MTRDAGITVDAGIDSGVRDAGVRAGPLFVFVQNGRCPDGGVERDLIPRGSERLELVKTTPLMECSGAGGDWLIGTRLNGGSVAFGDHACYFIPDALMMRDWTGLARFDPNRPTVTTPQPGWCIPQIANAPVVVSWGIYPTELDASAARAALTP